MRVINCTKFIELGGVQISWEIKLKGDILAKISVQKRWIRSFGFAGEGCVRLRAWRERRKYGSYAMVAY